MFQEDTSKSWTKTFCSCCETETENTFLIQSRLKCSIIFMSNKIKLNPSIHPLYRHSTNCSPHNIFTSFDLRYSELRSIMTLPSHFPKVPRVKVYVFMCLLLSLSLSFILIQLLILHQLRIHSRLYWKAVWVSISMRWKVASREASWRKRNETDGNDKKLIGQYRHQL